MIQGGNLYIENFQDGLKMIEKNSKKYIKKGAYQILNKIQTTQLMTKPHNFIPAFLVENLNSQSTPVRQVLHASKFYPQQETSLNVNMHNLPCGSPDQGNILLYSILYPKPVSLNVSAAFHWIKFLESQRQFQNLITFDFSRKDWENHPLLIFNKSPSFGVKQSPPICEEVI